MYYLKNEEKQIRSFFKKKVSFNSQTLVKFLITGIIGLSVTACGGGGSSSSSTNVSTQKPTFIQKQNSTGNLTTINQTYTNQGEINLTNSSLGIIGSNSDIINKGNIYQDSLASFTSELYPELNFETVLAKTYYKALQEMGIKVGIFAEKGSVLNEATIAINGMNSYGIIGIYSNIINNGDIILNGDYVVGIKGENSKLINNKNIVITSDNETETQPYSDIITPGAAASIGIDGENGSIINKGNINMTGNGLVGIYGYNSNIITEKTSVINLSGKVLTGIYGAANSNIENNGSIIINATGDISLISEGILVEGKGKAVNNGTITVNAYKSIGMKATAGGTVINGTTGVINVGKDGIGMVAEGTNSLAENYGTINVASNAEAGMRAWNGGTVANYGTIIIDKNYLHTGNTENMTKQEVAIYADENSTIKNYGTIKTDGNVSIEIGGTYTVGINNDGTFGKISARDINLNGNIIVSTDIVKGSYENSYQLDNIIEGEKITLGENYKSLSNSILYDLQISKDENGNIDGELLRNSTSLINFTNDNFEQVAKLLDKYLIKENYEKLSKIDKELIDKIFSNTASAHEINEAIEKLAGVEYLNTSRQIFNIKDSFRKYDTSIISTLDKYDYNFILVGEYEDISSKNEIEGYNSKMSGFDGAFKFSDTIYGTLGYGYSSINYDRGADGEIQTIHSGIYKDYKYNEMVLRLGIFGEYNFHDISRENLYGKINNDFNSYLAGITGEISKKYEDTLYFIPKFTLDISYLNIENFNEKYDLEVKKQEYTSVLPKAEILIGKQLNNIDLFTKASYSYELGNLDKNLNIEILNNTVEVKNNTMNKESINFSIGTKLNFENFSLGVELGKEFGQRDKKYVTLDIIYKF